MPTIASMPTVRTTTKIWSTTSCRPRLHLRRSKAFTRASSHTTKVRTRKVGHDHNDQKLTREASGGEYDPMPQPRPRLTADQRNSFVAALLGWTMDAFDYFLVVFVLS